MRHHEISWSYVYALEPAAMASSMVLECFLPLTSPLTVMCKHSSRFYANSVI
jgi:hypothetical protein